MEWAVSVMRVMTMAPATAQVSNEAVRLSPADITSAPHVRRRSRLLFAKALARRPMQCTVHNPDTAGTVHSQHNTHILTRAPRISRKIRLRLVA